MVGASSHQRWRRGRWACRCLSGRADWQFESIGGSRRMLHASLMLLRGVAGWGCWASSLRRRSALTTPAILFQLVMTAVSETREKKMPTDVNLGCFFFFYFVKSHDYDELPTLFRSAFIGLLKVTCVISNKKYVHSLNMLVILDKIYPIILTYSYVRSFGYMYTANKLAGKAASVVAV